MATQVRTGAAQELTEEGLFPVPGLASRWVRLPDGNRAHYVTSGDTGPAVILLHGGTEGDSGTSNWWLTAPFLGAHGFRVYCPDMSGYGLADTRPDYLDKKPKSHVDFVVDFANALCLNQFHLAGVAGGSMDAVKVAVSNPDRLLSIVFISGAFGPQVDYATRVLQGDGTFWPEAKGYVSPKFDGSEESMRSVLDGLVRNKEAIPAGLVSMSALAANRQRAAREANPGNAQDTNAHDIVWATKDRINILELPMLCLYGLASSWLPVENAFAQEDYIPNIQFFFPDNCGHNVPLDRPELFNQLYLEFIRDGKVSWPTAESAGVSRRRPVSASAVSEPAGDLPAPRPEIYSSLEALRAGLSR